MITIKWLQKEDIPQICEIFNENKTNIINSPIELLTFFDNNTIIGYCEYYRIGKKIHLTKLNIIYKKNKCIKKLKKRFKKRNFSVEKWK